MINGQILLGSERCLLLSKAIKENNCKIIFEIGTWRGLGSTLCIINSITSDSKFISLESNKGFHEIAIRNLEKYKDKVELIYGSIVTLEEIDNFVKDFVLDEIKKKWLEEDLENIKMSPYVLGKVPNEIDFLFLDGGEFSTYCEWLKLKNRSKIVGIDDIKELKTSLIYQEILRDPEYEVLYETHEGNGLCIFKKR